MRGGAGLGEMVEEPDGAGMKEEMLAADRWDRGRELKADPQGGRKKEGWKEGKKGGR